MKLSFLVTAEVDRDSGLFASRDELVEKFDAALASAADDVDLSGVGANSDSEYSVSEFTVYELNPSSEKAAWLDHSERVAQDYPGDKKILDRARRATLRIKELEAEVASLGRKLEAKRAAVEEGATRVMLGYYDDARTYLPDSTHDKVYFELGDPSDDHQVVAVNIATRGWGDEKYSVLEVYALGRSIAIHPSSGNTCQISTNTGH
jgi:hypothetical protein